MDAVDLLRIQLAAAHAALDSAVDGVSSRVAMWQPPGTAPPIGASYAQAVIVEDVVVQATLRGTRPLFASTWDNRVGVSDCMPLPGPLWDEFTWPDYSYVDWTRMTRVSLPKVRRYARAVHEETETWLATLTSAGVQRPVDLTRMGQGIVTVGWTVSRLVVGQIDLARGEIGCVRLMLDT